MANSIRAFKNHYRIDGKRYDRVTAVFDALQPKSLVDWKLEQGKEEAERLSKEAMAIGSRVDSICQKIMAGEAVSVASEPIEVRNCIEGFRRWMAEEQPAIVDWQETYWDEHMGVAGTLDIRLKSAIVDIKCSDKISPNYWLQVAMYAHMSRLNNIRIGILLLDKMTSDYEYKVIPFDFKLVGIYQGLLNYYRYTKGVEDEVTDREE